MPQVIPAVVAWAGSTAFTVAGVAVTYGTLVQAAVIAGSIAYSSAQNRKLQNQLKSLGADRGRDVMARDPLAYRRLIYGQVRTTGPVVFMATEGTKNEYLHLVIALADHECHELGEISIDDGEQVALDGSGNATGRLAGYFTVKKYVGTAAQAASPELITAFPGVWTTDHKLSGIAYIHAKLKFSADLYPNGLPVIKCLVKGVKVFDPRDAGQDSATPSTWLWSCNSALCTAHYINDSRFGRGVAWARIKEADLEEAANVCDEAVGRDGSFTATCNVASGNRHIGIASTSLLVVGMQVSGSGIPTGTRIVSTDASETFFTVDRDPTITNAAVVLTFGAAENRYETHGTVMSDQLRDNVTLDLAGAMAGHAIDTGGIWTIRAGAYRTPTVTLTDGDLAGPFSMIPRMSRRDTYNGVKGTYISPYNQWSASDFPAVKNDTYMGWDGNVRLWKDIVLAFTTSPAMAQRLAKIDLERGRQQITVEATYKLKAFECMPIDTVYLTREEMGWTNKEFEVSNWKFTVIQGSGAGISLGVTLSLRETASAVWDWSAEETLVDIAPNTSLPNPLIVGVPVVTLLTSSATTIEQPDGTIQPRLKVSWNTPNDIFVEQGGFTEIEYKLSSDADSEYRLWLTVRGDMLQEYITDIKVGLQYHVRVRFRNQIGVHGAYCTPVLSSVIVGGTSVPAVPASLTATAVPGFIRLVWPPSTNNAVHEYIIERSITSAVAGFALLANVVLSQYDDPSITPGTQYWYRVRAVTSSEVESVNSSVATATAINPAVGATVPGTPGSDPIRSSGTYGVGYGIKDADDGRIVAWEKLDFSGGDANTTVLNMLYRQTGSTEWNIAGQFEATGASITATFDDLTPGVSYDWAIQYYSAAGGSAVGPTRTYTSATKTAGPAAPGSPTFYSSGPAAKRFASTGPIMYASRVMWTKPADKDIDYYNVKAVDTNNSASTTASGWHSGESASSYVYKTKELYFDFYASNLFAGYVFIQAVNTSGIAGSWATPGTNINGSAGVPAADMASQTSSAVAVTGGTATGITDLAATSEKLGSGSSVRPTKARWVSTESVTIAGGATSEDFAIDITNRGFSTKPDAGLIQVSGASVAADLRDVLALYVYDHGSNSSTTAYVTCFRKDGANLTAGNIRLSIEFLEY